METITRTVLTADEGMVLTDGKNFGKEVYLKVGEDGSAWHQITEEEYAEIVQAQENGFAAGTDNATETDYQNALERLGVVFGA